MTLLSVLPRFKLREDYLREASSLFSETFPLSLGGALPRSFRVSVGFPGGGSARKRIGEHWHPKSTSDGISQIFISPVLEDSKSVLSTLLHEMIHACYPDAGHKGAFKRLALQLGFTPPMKSTPTGKELAETINDLSWRLGPYPHAKINLSDRKKQGTRMIKCECQDCGYVCRTTRQWIEDAGTPICPCNHEPMETQA